MNYDHKKIEKKWQKWWEEQATWQVTEDDQKEKSYLLVEFPYPSGAGLHVGHPRSYTAMDVLAHKQRMQGFNVLYPMGFDAFGLPTENYAVKTGRHPRDITEENITTFRRQLKSLGYSFDWSREIDTTDPNYYKWTQWIFLQLYKKGLAYKAKTTINWCPSCKIGLAHEEVVEGKCERCGSAVEQREKEQWMLKITAYADRLIDDLETVDYLPRIKSQQINWIGRSEGINLKNKIKDLGIEFEVYDSVPQTFMAQTFAVIAPEHPLVEKMIAGTEHEKSVQAFVETIKQKKAANRFSVDKDIDGIFTGRYIENYANTGRDLPIWVASFALMDYGTGIVNCSAHDERDFAFAKKYDISLHPVMFPADPVEAERVKNLEYCYSRAEDGILQEPKEFTGRKWGEVREDIIAYIEKQGWGKRSVNYKLRDWVFSRQRYWGEPIPIMYCRTCWEKSKSEIRNPKEGIDYVVINDAKHAIVPDERLPVELPQVEKYEPTDTGESPLAAMTDWVKTKCPTCGGGAERETDTMPTWAGSSWYYLAYCLSDNNKLKSPNFKSLLDKEPQASLKYWAPVDWYNGGMEHTTLHLLYSRFWHKFLFDIGVVPTAEPYAKRTSHGMILAEDSQKMSKSRGNVVNPDDVVATYGADTLRTYEMFMGPFADMIPWNTRAIGGVRRFLDRVWHLAQGSAKSEKQEAVDEKQIRNKVASTIKRVSEAIDTFRFNTAVSAMMELTNFLYTVPVIAPGRTQAIRSLLILLFPFAPHVAAELWEQCVRDNQPVWQQSWPTYDEQDLVADMVIVVVQVNGKVRGSIEVAAGSDETVVTKVATAQDNVKKWLTEKEVVKVIFREDKLVNFVVR